MTTVRTYEKLVRKKIPEIIKANGSTPRIIDLHRDSPTLVKKFHSKIAEEMNELISAKSTDEIIEEAADLVQIVLDYLGTKGFTVEDLETVRHAKAIKCGTFFDDDKQIATYLADVTDH